MRLSVLFEDTEGTDIDPSTVLVKTYSPSGRITSYTYGASSSVGKYAVGNYYLDMTPDEGGRWHVRWEAASGTSQLAVEDDFIVQTSPFVASALGDYA